MKKLIYIFSAALLLIACNSKSKQDTEAAQDYTQVSPVFCEDSAYSYVAAQCDFGPRTMNSEAHDLCGEWIASTFTSFGATITDQYADVTLGDGTKTRMRNIIASYNPDATERVIVSSHWDSRPWADEEEDEALHNNAIDGANDGASGVGIMLEMARLLHADLNAKGDSSLLKLNPDYGIDFICWDAEDAGLHENNSSWCIGSQYWSGNHHKEGYTASYGILLDMVGGHNCVFRMEGYSMHFAKNIVARVWATGNRLGYGKYFVYPDNGSHLSFITDDHVQMNNCGIPSIDIIGNDSEGGSFPATWHTLNDNIKNISKETLKAVGQTVLETIWK